MIFLKKCEQELDHSSFASPAFRSNIDGLGHLYIPKNRSDFLQCDPSRLFLVAFFLKLFSSIIIILKHLRQRGKSDGFYYSIENENLHILFFLFTWSSGSFLYFIYAPLRLIWLELIAILSIKWVKLWRVSQ